MPGTLFSIRQILAYLAVVALVYLSRPQLPTFATGCVLAAIGIGFRVWGCGHLRKNEDLITSGPYAHVKHPLYLGTFLISAGGILAAGSPEMPGLLVWAVVGPVFLLAFFGYYLPKKRRVEGRRMEERFGEKFGPYKVAVPDFVPSLRAWPEASKTPWSWKIYRGNNELEMDLLIVALFAAVFVAGILRGGA